MVKTKKVRLLISIASANWSYAPGEIVEIDKDLADAWVKSGIAELLNDGEDEKPKSKRK